MMKKKIIPLILIWFLLVIPISLAATWHPSWDADFLGIYNLTNALNMNATNINVTNLYANLGLSEIEVRNNIDMNTYNIVSINWANVTKINVSSMAYLQALTAYADLDIGDFEFRAQTLEADVATGTSPFTIASTTKVANLNVDYLDDYTSAYFLPLNNTQDNTLVVLDQFNATKAGVTHYFQDNVNISGSLTIGSLIIGAMGSNLDMNGYSIINALDINATRGINSSAIYTGLISAIEGGSEVGLGAKIDANSNDIINVDDLNTTNIFATNLYATNLEKDLDGTGFKIIAGNFTDGTLWISGGNIINANNINSSLFNGTYYGDGRNLIISTTYNATNIATIDGTYDDGDLTSIQVPEDGLSYNVSEDSGANPLTIEINFTNVDNFDSIIGRVWYEGGLGHVIQIEILRTDTGVWENYLELTDTYDFINIYIPVFDPQNHIDANGNTSIRFTHIQSGIPTHNFYIDYLAIVDGFTALTIADHDSLGGRDKKVNHPWAMPTDASRNFTNTVYINSGGLDLNLTNITNVDWLFVHNITGYSPIDFRDSNVRIFGGNFSIDSNLFFVDDTNDYIGIGTNAPSEPLEVVGDMVVDSPTFFVNAATNKIGIGTISPVEVLDIVGDLNVTADIHIGNQLIAYGNLDIGSFDFQAQTFTSDIATGTAPFTVASTTEVANLNASYAGIAYTAINVNGYSSTYFWPLNTTQDANVTFKSNVTVEGNVTMFNEMYFKDNQRLCFGDDIDACIYWNTTHLVIEGY